MNLLKTEYILTIAIYSHGCENLLDPFNETDIVGDFYKNNVRVFSQSCVPDIPSISASSTHVSSAKKIRADIQNESSTEDTYSILAPYAESCKPTYTNLFRPETKALHTEFDDRLFETRYIDKTCGIMIYLSNKNFFFYENDPREPPLSLYLFGIVLLDVRVKETYDNGSIQYKRIFDPPERNNTPILLTTYDGLYYLLKTVLHKKPKDCNDILRSMGLKMGQKLTTIDLIKLYELFKLCGIQYVNILDYSCRLCQGETRLSPEQIEEIYRKEQHYSSLLPRFGGRYKSKTRKNRTKKNKRSKKIKRKNTRIN